jgi:hypothetical protein
LGWADVVPDINGVAHVILRANRIAECIAFYDLLASALCGAVGASAAGTPAFKVGASTRAFCTRDVQPAT